MGGVTRTVIYLTFFRKIAIRFTEVDFFSIGKPDFART